jgi:acetyl esterase/lipase
MYWLIVGILTGAAENVRRATADGRRPSPAFRALAPFGRFVTGHARDDVQVTTGGIDLAGRGTRDARIYRPPAAARAELPVIVSFHGGGWISGHVGQSEWWHSELAARAGAVVIATGYGLAPERTFPDPLEDCYAGLAWVVDNAARLGIDANRVAVMGNSVGGIFAAGVTLLARDRSGPHIALQLLINPYLDLAHDYPSEHEHADGPFLTRAYMRQTSAQYLAGHDATDPYASPMLARHDGLPAALIQTAGRDPLRDQGAAYAVALRAAGVPVRHTDYPHAVHGYSSMPGAVPSARRALREVVTVVRDVLHRPPDATGMRDFP